METNRVNVNVIDATGTASTGSIPQVTYDALPYYRANKYNVSVMMDNGYMIDVPSDMVYKR